MKSDPFTKAWAGVANQPISLTDDPPDRFHAVVRLTGVKTLVFELSVMLASVAVEAFGLTVSVAALVAVKATVATFDVRPAWAIALLAPTNSRAVAPARALFSIAGIARLQAKVL